MPPATRRAPSSRSPAAADGRPPAASGAREPTPGPSRPVGYGDRMQLGDIGNPGAIANGKPLDGVRILALEQMQALPYATQLLGRLGATVIKVESPKGGDLGRGSLPAMQDPQGRNIGATFMRNNLSKRSICVDLKHPDG